jgi:hypothetical protein
LPGGKFFGGEPVEILLFERPRSDEMLTAVAADALGPRANVPLTWLLRGQSIFSNISSVRASVPFATVLVQY